MVGLFNKNNVKVFTVFVAIIKFFGFGGGSDSVSNKDQAKTELAREQQNHFKTTLQFLQSKTATQQEKIANDNQAHDIKEQENPAPR